MSGSHLSAIPIGDVFSTGGFTVNPGEFTALKVPEDWLFVLTDVIVFPVITTSDPDFSIQYSTEEHVPGSPQTGVGVKFQYMDRWHRGELEPAFHRRHQIMREEKRWRS